MNVSKLIIAVFSSALAFSAFALPGETGSRKPVDPKPIQLAKSDLKDNKGKLLLHHHNNQHHHHHHHHHHRHNNYVDHGLGR